MIRYLSVCSGIEAASVAWKPLGWECAGVSEIDKFPRAVLQHRLGAVPVEDDHRWQPGQNFTPLFGDFTQIEAHHVGPVDLLVGGTPCQSFSIAGKRLGLDDPRGNLTLEFFALAERVRPTWIVWENVPGVLSHDDGRTFGTVLGLMGECGFRWAYRTLDAQHVRTRRFGRAVPQRRRRVFLVGYSGTADIHPRAVLFDRESLRGNPAPRREAGQGVAPTIAARTRGGGGLGTDFDCDGGLIAGTDWPASVAPTLNAHFGEKQGLEDQHIRGGAAYSSPAVANPLTARMHKGINTTADEGQTPIITHGGGFDGADVAHALRGEGFDASEDGTGRGTPIVPVQQPLSIMPMNSGKDYKARETDVAQPIMAGGPVGGNQGGDFVATQHPIAIQERAVSENPGAGPDGKGWRDDGAAYTLEARQVTQAVATIAFTAKDHGGDAVENISPTLRAGGHTGSHANAGVMPAVAFRTSPNCGAWETGERTDALTTSTDPTSHVLVSGDAEPFTIMERGRDGQSNLESRQDGTANAILTPNGGRGGLGVGAIAAAWGVRRLTPTECARLQGFPDDWARIPWRGKPAEECPDGPQYKAFGNSMAVNVMTFIGERIEAVRDLI